MVKKPTIGFIGQGWIGRNYAANFRARGFETICYSLEEPHIRNKDRIKDCDIVFIAVPTPTTPKGFDIRIVEGGLKLLKKGQIAVIKSTIIPGTTADLQKKYPGLTIMYSPEFLSEATAAHDASNPFSNIIGLPTKSPRHIKAGKLVHSLLPKAPFTLTCTSTEAEIIKYTHNGSGYVQIIFFNLMHDIAAGLGCDWAPISAAIKADPLISGRYSNPVHKGGRGAGGGCFIKDFAALRALHGKKHSKDKSGKMVFEAIEKKNIELLKSTKKDLELLKGVYGNI